MTTLGGAAACGESASSQHKAGSPAAGAADVAKPDGSTGGGALTGNQAQSKPATGPAAPSAPAPAAGKDLANVTVASRSLVYTATLTVRTKDVSTATANATHLALANGGFVGDEKATSGTLPDVPGITQSTITLRVPSDKFDTVLDQLGTGGTVQAQTRSASDVTGQVVDTTSRIASAQASIARVTELMKSATGLADVVSLEGELSRREADLESLKSQLASLSDQVQLSTITVTYLVPQASTTAAPPPKEQNALQRGLHDGWVAFVGVVKVLLIVGGAVLPFAILAAVLWWPVRRIMRLADPLRGERRRAAVRSAVGGGESSGPDPRPAPGPAGPAGPTGPGSGIGA